MSELFTFVEKCNAIFFERYENKFMIEYYEFLQKTMYELTLLVRLRRTCKKNE